MTRRDGSLLSIIGKVWGTHYTGSLSSSPSFIHWVLLGSSTNLCLSSCSFSCMSMLCRSAVSFASFLLYTYWLVLRCWASSSECNRTWISAAGGETPNCPTEGTDRRRDAGKWEDRKGCDGREQVGKDSSGTYRKVKVIGEVEGKLILIIWDEEEDMLG